MVLWFGLPFYLQYFGKCDKIVILRSKKLSSIIYQLSSKLGQWARQNSSVFVFLPGP
jgi:hypothetical protein